MTRDDIIRLAREAGATAVKFNSTSDAEIIVPRGLDVELFAQLVVAAERERIAKIAEAWDVEHPYTNYGRCIANAIRSME